MNFKNSLSATIIFTLTLIITSCQTSEFDAQLLIGGWKINKWEIKETGQVRTNKMDMKFSSEGTYEIDYGTEIEKGKYWLANDYLHTVETNKSEKKVRIINLNSDSLNFEMNRGGILENVLLVKKL